MASMMSLSDTGPVKVLYIGGLGRSGSTLLDRMLGQLPGYFSAGEIRDLWQRGLTENRLCGCGEPFHDCPFWTRVGKEAYGGWDQIEVPQVIALARHVDRHSLWPLLLRPGLWPSFERRLGAYLEILSPLYRAIHEVGDTRVIVDSSKAPSSAFVLRRLPGLDLRAVHLIRDSRGVAYSWNKKVVRPDTPGKVVYMHRYHPSRIGARWITRNGFMELLGRLGVPEVRVSYEQMVRSPREQVERIVSILDAPVEPSDYAFIGTGEVYLGVNHTVMGNPIRMQAGPVALRLDEEWRTRMDRRQSGMVTALTWPFLRRYGYHR